MHGRVRLKGKRDLRQIADCSIRNLLTKRCGSGRQDPKNKDGRPNRFMTASLTLRDPALGSRTLRGGLDYLG